jgi:hypothetical protein
MVYKTAPRQKIVSVYTVGNLVYYFPKTFPVFLRLFPHEQKSGTEYSVGYRDKYSLTALLKQLNIQTIVSILLLDQRPNSGKEVLFVLNHPRKVISMPVDYQSCSPKSL